MAEEEPSDRITWLYMARTAEKAKLYADCVEYMKKIALLDTDLSVDERYMFSIAHKNYFGSYRASWKTLCGLEEREEKDSSDRRHIELVRLYKTRIESVLREKFKDLVEIVEGHILPNASLESKSFFLKMKGDYYRYFVDLTPDIAEKIEAGKSSLAAYEEATEITKSILSPADPFRLGLALSFMVYYDDVAKDHEMAQFLAKRAFEEGTADLENIAEDVKKDAEHLLHLLECENL